MEPPVVGGYLGLALQRPGLGASHAPGYQVRVLVDDSRGVLAGQLAEPLDVLVHRGLLFERPGLGPSHSGLDRLGVHVGDARGRLPIREVLEPPVVGCDAVLVFERPGLAPADCRLDRFGVPVADSGGSLAGQVPQPAVVGRDGLLVFKVSGLGPGGGRSYQGKVNFGDSCGQFARQLNKVAVVPGLIPLVLQQSRFLAGRGGVENLPVPVFVSGGQLAGVAAEPVHVQTVQELFRRLLRSAATGVRVPSQGDRPVVGLIGNVLVPALQEVHRLLIGGRSQRPVPSAAQGRIDRVLFALVSLPLEKPRRLVVP